MANKDESLVEESLHNLSRRIEMKGLLEKESKQLNRTKAIHVVEEILGLLAHVQNNNSLGGRFDLIVDGIKLPKGKKELLVGETKVKITLNYYLISGVFRGEPTSSTHFSVDATGNSEVQLTLEKISSQIAKWLDSLPV
ncbi:hypothetical protein [Flavobacterium sp.]|uniref:hypothetical protein n=1 Tax=Flavobacterium sp. TaxID=239 RepID=UPI00326464B4